MVTILGKLLCGLGLHNEEIVLKCIPKNIHTGKDKKHYYSLRYDVWRVVRCKRCHKIHWKYKVRANLKEQQARLFITNYVELKND